MKVNLGLNFDSSGKILKFDHWGVQKRHMMQRYLKESFGFMIKKWKTSKMSQVKVINKNDKK